MMSTPQIIITIPEPCSENWEAMTPADRGRFCASCQKTVIDFTILTDREIYDMLSAAKGQPFCGHLFTVQINKPISAPQQHSFPRILISKVAAAFLFFQAIAVHARAQVAKHPTHQQAKIKGKGAEAKYNQRGISGSVKDHTTGAPLGAMIVQIQGTSINATTDKKGNFFLALPDAFALKKVTLTASYADTAMKLPGTVILDEVVEIDSMERIGVTLYRYPEAESRRVEVMAYMVPLVGTSAPGGIRVQYIVPIKKHKHWYWPFNSKNRKYE